MLQFLMLILLRWDRLCNIVSTFRLLWFSSVFVDIADVGTWINEHTMCVFLTVFAIVLPIVFARTSKVLTIEIRNWFVVWVLCQQCFSVSCLGTIKINNEFFLQCYDVCMIYSYVNMLENFKFRFLCLQKKCNIFERILKVLWHIMLN